MALKTLNNNWNYFCTIKCSIEGWNFSLLLSFLYYFIPFSWAEAIYCCMNLSFHCIFSYCELHVIFFSSLVAPHLNNNLSKGWLLESNESILVTTALPEHTNRHKLAKQECVTPENIPFVHCVTCVWIILQGTEGAQREDSLLSRGKVKVQGLVKHLNPSPTH